MAGQRNAGDGVKEYPPRTVVDVTTSGWAGEKQHVGEFQIAFWWMTRNGFRHTTYGKGDHCVRTAGADEHSLLRRRDRAPGEARACTYVRWHLGRSPPAHPWTVPGVHWMYGIVCDHEQGPFGYALNVLEAGIVGDMGGVPLRIPCD